MPEGDLARRLPVGAEVVEGAVDFRVWAPGHQRIEVLIEHRPAVALVRSAAGWFGARVPGVAAGARYRYRLDGGPAVADPASRFQPEGPHGPSEVIDPRTFSWTDRDWPGVEREDAVVYELHIGTFTREGTYAAAAEHLAELAELGVTVIEVLPLADFPGRFGWGYDGVAPFAPTRLYGRPDDLRTFIDRAHGVGLAVILDVVYNHLGPDGCSLGAFTRDYFSRRHRSEWGDSYNFDEQRSDAVRAFVLANVRHWLDEYHFDGLRLDATQQVYDTSEHHILGEITGEVRATAPARRTLVIAENEPQEARFVRSPERGGFGMDALWNDDLHHAMVVALTGRREAYYTDYRGSAAELVAAARHGFLYQGQWYAWQRGRRGASALDLSPTAQVNFLQNHDQVANSASGERITALAAPAPLRAMTAYLLLAPGIPMLFMGQEFGASSPFLFFADHQGDLARAVFAGRREFLAQFPSFALPEIAATIPDPADPTTFERSRLDHGERAAPRGRAHLALHRDLLALRRSEPAIRAAVRDRHALDGATLGSHAFVLRYFDPDGAGGPGDRLLLVNLGVAGPLDIAPEPLLAPPDGHHWTVAWSSEDPRYGGMGTPDPETAAGWVLPGAAAVLLAPISGPQQPHDGAPGP